MTNFLHSHAEVFGEFIERTARRSRDALLSWLRLLGCFMQRLILTRNSDLIKGVNQHINNKVQIGDRMIGARREAKPR